MLYLPARLHWKCTLLGHMFERPQYAPWAYCIYCGEDIYLAHGLSFNLFRLYWTIKGLLLWRPWRWLKYRLPRRLYCPWCNKIVLFEKDHDCLPF